MKTFGHIYRLMILLSGGLGVYAQDSTALSQPVDSTPPPQSTVLDTSSNNILLNVDIFGQSAVGSYYILWDNLDLSVEMKTILTSRNLAADEFFMQNIDREQFEQDRILQLFEDQKKEFFKLFPDEDE